MKITHLFVYLAVALFQLSYAVGQQSLSFQLATPQSPPQPGESATLSFSLLNRNVVDATNVDFSLNLPAGVVLASPPNPQTSCVGGTFTASAGASSFQYSDGVVSASTQCEVTVDVVAALAGDYLIETEALTSSAGTSASASAILSIQSGESQLGVALDSTVSGTEVTFDLYFENLAAESLDEVIATLNLANTFGAGNYLFLSAPSFVDEPGTLPLNPDFNGNSDTNLFLLPTNVPRVPINPNLAASDTAQVRFVVEVLDASVGDYSSQAYVTARSSTAITTDLSDSGTDPDPNGNSDAGEAGENDPTLFSIAELASIGMATTVEFLPSSDIRIVWVLENLGNVPLEAVTLSSDLNAVFGAGNYIHLEDPNRVDRGEQLNLNASYNGNSNTSVFNGGTLESGERAVVRSRLRLTNVTDQGLGLGNYSYQVTVSAQDPAAAAVSDVSDFGLVTDPNGNGLADDPGEDDPTIIPFNDRIGLAKDVAVAANNITFDYYLEAFGSATIDDLSLQANYNGIFGAGNYQIVSATLVDDPGTITLNPGFDGFNTTELMAAGSTLAAADTAQIQVVVELLQVSNQGDGFGSYNGNAFVYGTLPGGISLFDESTSGTNPDPNGNGLPDDAGENQATTFTADVESLLGAALNASISGTEITFDFYLENFGNSVASSLSAAFDLDAIFGSGNYSITSAPAFISDPGTITLNGSYDGSSESDLFNASSTLAAAATSQIRLVVDVTEVTDPFDSGTGVYEAQIEINSLDSLDRPQNDLSTNGTDPDANSNSDPTDDLVPTPFLIGNTALGVALKVDMSGTQATFIYTVQNLGSLPVENLFLQNPLNPVLGSGNYSIVQQPRLIEGPGTLILSPQYFGFNIFDRIIVGGSIAAGETIRFTIIVNINTVTDQGNGFGVYQNQVSITGSNLNDSVSDASDHGFFADTNDNGTADDAGEDDVTTFIIGDESSIGLAESVSVNGSQVTLDIYLENLGASSLSSISLNKNLDDIFGAGNYSLNAAPTFVDDPGTLTINPSYDGSATDALFSAGTLPALDTAQVRIIVDVTSLIDAGSGFGVYQSQSQVSANAPLGSLAFDISDSGIDPDPNGNGFAFEADENDPASFSLQTSELGVALDVATDFAEATFIYTIENLNDLPISNLSLTHDLDALFGAGNYTILNGPDFTDTERDLELNTGFDGNSETELIAGGTLGQGVGEQFAVTVLVNLLQDNGSGLGVYTTQVTASGTGADGNLTDLSDDGQVPDTDENGLADGPGEDDPSTFTLVEDASIGIARSATISGREVTLDYYLENFGQVTAGSLSLTEDLDAIFGAGNYSITSAPVLADDPGTITLEAGFDGASTTQLIASGSLSAADTAQIRLVVEVTTVSDQGDGLGIYAAQSTLTGLTPSGVSLSDLSGAGTDPDSNDNGDPSDSEESDVLNFSLEANVGDFVWNDLDGNGIQDGGEPGLSGVTVFLDLNENGTLDGGEPSATTGVSGSYDITNVAAGDYSVRVDNFSLPSGFVLSTANSPLAVNLFAGEDVNNADFGYQQQNARIGDFVWNDLDGDGLQDAGEPGLSGITVYLDLNSNGTLDGGEPNSTTDANGAFDFTGLATGIYSVRVDAATVSSVFFLSTGNNPLTVNLAAGEDFNAADFGYVDPPALGFTKSFASNPATVAQVNTLTFTLDNTGSTVDAANIDFTDALPAGMTVATPANASTTATGGTLTAVAGSGTISYTGGSIAAGATATVTVDVTTSTSGDFDNTSGDLTSNLGNSGTASDSLRVNAPPSFAKAFDTDPIAFGDTVTLTFTIDNSGSTADATGIDFTDNMPAGMIVATPPNASTTVTGGTLTAVADNGTISYTGGTISAGATATVSVDVTTTTSGDFANTSGDLTSSLGNSGTAADSLRVNPQPGFSKSFAPDTILLGGTSTLTFTIDNTGSTVDATSIDFTDNLPAGMIVATPANASTTATGGTLTSIAGNSTLSYTGGTVSAGSSATVSVDVTTTTSGDFNNTSGDLTSNLGNSGTAADSLRVNPTPGFSKSFTPGTILLGETSTLTFSIDNSDSTVPAASIDFTDALPAGMTVATPANASTTATGGTLTAVAGSSTISYTAGSIAAGASTTVSVDVTTSTFGDFDNTSGDLTSSLGNSGTASDSLRVNAPPSFVKAFATDPIAFGDTVTLTFTINNSGSTADATGIDFTDNMPAGMIVATPPNASTTVTGGTLTAVAGSNSISYTGGSVSAGSSATVSVNLTTTTSGDFNNTSGDLTSSLGNSGTASDSLRVNPQPGFSKVFAPDTILLGGISTLTFTIDNTGSTVDATSIDFTDVLPAGMIIATPANASTTATGGTLTAVAGNGTLSYSGGTVAAGGSATVSVDVTTTTSGDFDNTSGDLTSSLGNSGTAADSLRVNPSPGFSKSFTPGTILLGETSTLTFSIDNSDSTVPAASIDFTDALPAGMTVATPANASTTATGGTLTAVAGSGTISYTAGSIAAGASATVSVDVTTSTSGDFDNTSGDLTSSLGNSGTASDSLRVNAPPSFAKAFASDPIALGETVTLSFTINNSGSTADATGIDFTDNLPAGMIVATPPNASTTATGGTLTAVAGSNSISYTGGSITAGASATVSVDVTTTTSGDFNNTSGDLTSNLGNSGTASDSLRVNPQPGFSKIFASELITLDEVVTLTFTINNSDSTVAATGLSFTDTLPDGLVVAETPNASTNCTGGTLTAIAGSSEIEYSGGSLDASSSCTLTVDLVGVAGGEWTNLTGDLLSSLGNSGTATDSIVINSDPFLVNGGIPHQTMDEDDPALDFDLLTAFDDAEDGAAALTYTVTANDNATLVTATIVSDTTLRLSLAADLNGSAEITVTATDSLNRTVESTFTLTVAPINDAPTTSGITDINKALDDLSDDVIDLFAAFADIDNLDSELTYTVENATRPELIEGALIDGPSGTLTLSYPYDAEGSTTLTLRAQDPGGLFVETEFTITLAGLTPPAIDGTGTDASIEISNSLNIQTGLLEQTVTVTNESATTTIEGFTLTISNLPEGTEVYNANDLSDSDEPQIKFSVVLLPGESLTFIVEYFQPLRDTDFSPVLTLELGNDLETDPLSGTPIPVTPSFTFEDGRRLLDFPTTPGNQYTIQYSADMSTWTTVFPPLNAVASSLQWIDNGPPKTFPHPDDVSQRFYRVFESE